MMDRGDTVKNSVTDAEPTYDTRQAKQRATVKWLLSKAFNNKVPENLREPFYRNHENQEHVKPQVLHALANAELYCLALGNIYSDPNYHNLNHWGVLQALNRKNISINEPHLTETVLIQTNPLKMSAHMTVMEAVMTLYTKEVATPDRVLAAVRRFSQNSSINDEPPDHEKALVMWINEAVKALRQRILQETGQGDQSRIPDIPPITDVQELCDGIGLAALVSFYCPDDLPWRKIVVNKVPTISDCVRNLLLVHDFCQQSLPYSIFHMMPEDVSYLRGSMKSNLIVFLADLFNVLEIHPAKCVRFDHAAASLTDGAVMSPVVNKKSSQSNQEYFNDDRRNTEDQFVVHRGRSVPTLSSVAHNNIAEKSPISNDVAAGRPSNWEDSRRSSYAGRRSRRNSLSEDSQLTVENFGGSQENLQFLGRNPDKEPAVHVGRKDPSPSPSPKTIAQENRNSSGLHSVLINNLQNESNEVVSPSPKPSLSRQSSLRSKSSNHAETMSSAGLQQSLFDPEEEVVPVKRNSEPAIKRNSDVPAIKRNSEVPTQEKKVTSFANLPSNTTTWQQQRDINSHVQTEREETETETEVMGSQLLNIRLKLEEKRRLIESEKRRMEAVFNKQRQQFGKAAFLQAVTKDISEVEQKWLDGKSQNLAFLEDKKTPDYDNMDLEQYQKSMSQMNSSLHEIQEDLQRLTLQQKQMRQEEPAPVQMQSFASLSQNKPTMQSFVVNNHQTSLSVNQQQSMFNQPANQMNHINNHLQNEQQWHSLQQPQLMNSFANHQNHQNHQPMLINQQQPINSYISQPTVNNYVNNRQQSYAQQQSQPLNNYMNQQQTMSSNYVNQSPSSFTVSHLPVNNYSKQDSGSNFSSPQRQMHSLVNDHPQSQINTNTYSVNQQNMQYRSFVSTNNSNQQSTFSQQQQQVNQLIRNSQESSDQSSPSSQFFLHDQPSQRKTWQQTTPVNISTEPRNTWVNNRLNNRQSQPSSLSSSPLSNSGFTLHHNGSSDHSAPTPPPRRSSNSSITHAPVPTPSVDDMEPQSISFIVKSNEKMTDEEEFSEGLSRLQITSGNRTYRIPSPTRSHARLNQQNMQSQNQPEKGFYISFDDDSPPKRPKPPLRVKRASPKKERGLTQIVESNLNNINHDPINFGQDDYRPSPNRADRSPPKRTVFPQPSIKNEPTSVPDSPLSAKQRPTTNVGLIIDNELNNCDPSTIDEMERRKERILLLSLQRRQQQEELKARKELEAQQRREKEKQKEEDRARKKEEEKARRAAILEQYKLKKAIEEAEREGKNIDKELQNSLKLSNLGNRGPPRLRNKQNTRPRPKTIHIDHGHHHSDHTDGMLTPSSGKKGSTSNLSVLSSPMRRDYYRGSQDCLAETRRTSVSGASLYSDYGEDSRGASPGRSLGRRSSYKTSRDPSPEGLRSKSKFNTYATRRKSNSLMNLSGSSCEQDSLLYRYGDTDSGLGRATPPRRAPSPGHPPSPSGPGSLPARRRYNDDTASESGGSEYSGPRLYKQPATKSNRGIILNAVEYCVFPGVVNKDAKRRVLDEINRSEAKHFLILFRDAGCQFRALYSYCPDSEEVAKLYGTGPKLVTDRMFDKFFKYNSGGKCFSQVHTKHLTVTIDAFTIHNSLWQGKKMVNLPSKRDMTLVI